MIEEFFKSYYYTFVAVSAIATVLAVIISLCFGYQTLKVQTPQINARIEILLFKGGFWITEADILGADDCSKYLTISITNAGSIPVRVRSVLCIFKIPFNKAKWYAVPDDLSSMNINIPRKSYPVTIEPRSEVTFFLVSKDAFMKEIKTRAVRALDQLLIRFLVAEIITDDRSLFKAEISKELKQQIINKVKSMSNES